MPQTRKTIGRAAAATALAGLLALPAAASADDQSVYNTFHSSHPRFQELRREEAQGERHWEDSEYRDPEDAYRACRRTSALSRKVVDKLQAKHTSTDLGQKARHYAVKGIVLRRRWADAERRAIESFMNFDGAAYIDLHRKAEKYLEHAQKAEEQAQKYFKEAGVNRNP